MRKWPQLMTLVLLLVSCWVLPASAHAGLQWLMPKHQKKEKAPKRHQSREVAQREEWQKVAESIEKQQNQREQWKDPLPPELSTTHESTQNLGSQKEDILKEVAKLDERIAHLQSLIKMHHTRARFHQRQNRLKVRSEKETGAQPWVGWQSRSCLYRARLLEKDVAHIKQIRSDLMEQVE